MALAFHCSLGMDCGPDLLLFPVMGLAGQAVEFR